MSFGYRVLPLVVAAVLLAVLLWYGGNGWLGFALGVFAGGFRSSPNFSVFSPKRESPPSAAC